MNLERLSKSFLCLFVLAVLVPGLVLGATGKIRGTVTDAETGEPLFGANVVIEGTPMGAATDVNGEYIILNVPPGKHTLVVTYIGYKKYTVQEVIVRAGLTEFRDIQLPKVVLEGEEVVIVADRPLIDKSETNEIHYLRGEEIAQMPIRGVAAAITAMAGVVDDGGIHVRGGREDEMAYVVDGVNTSNSFGGETMVSIISNAIEEVQLQTGGMGAEYGGKMSGFTITSLKTGAAKYNFTGEFISDDFWAIKDQNYEILGINGLYSYGYNDYVLTASGPIVPSYKDLRFYIAAQSYNRMSAATRYEGFTMSDTLALPGIFTDWHGTQHRDTLNLFIDQPGGRLPGGGQAGLTFNGNLVWDVKPFRIKLGGVYALSRSTGETTAPGGIPTIGLRDTRFHNGNYSAFLNVTHTIDPTMFYTLNAGLARNFWESGDPLMGWDEDSWIDWGDPAINPTLLDTSQTWGSYPIPFEPSITIGGAATAGGQPTGWYNKGYEDKYHVKFDFTKQFGKTHEVKLGGEYSLGLYRQFWFNGNAYMRRLRDVAKDPDSYSEWDVYEPIVTIRGYDWFGNEVDEDNVVETKLGLPSAVEINLHNAPPKPKTAGFYLTDRIELRDLIINAGLRFDYFNYGHPSLASLDSLTKGPGEVVDEQWFGDPKVYSYLSPRLGFSFPVTDQASFHAQYGKYIQPPNISYSWTYRSYLDFTEFLYGGVYFAPLHNPNLKPERTTSYEFGVQMAFGTNASLDVTAFYKDTRDLITARTILPRTADYRTPTFFMNGDFGTITGFTATFNLRRTSRVQANLNYTYQNAQGTGSQAGSHFDIAWQEENPHFPRIIAPMDFDIRHKGTIVIDFRSTDEDGPEVFGIRPLANIGLNMKFDFNSGSPYTRIPQGDAFSSLYGYNAPPPLESPMSSTLPWLYQLDAKLDKTFMVGPVKMNVYLWAINLLDIKSITNVRPQTGRPDSDGWLDTNAGKARAADIEAMGYSSEEWKRWYNAALSSCGTWGWQGPRQIRFGLKFEI